MKVPAWVLMLVAEAVVLVVAAGLTRPEEPTHTLDSLTAMQARQRWLGERSCWRWAVGGAWALFAVWVVREVLR